MTTQLEPQFLYVVLIIVRIYYHIHGLLSSLFFVLGVTLKAALALLHTMDTRRAAHKAVLVRARQLVAVLDFFLLAFHSYNITHK